MDHLCIAPVIAQEFFLSLFLTVRLKLISMSSLIIINPKVFEWAEIKIGDIKFSYKMLIPIFCGLPVPVTV